MLFYFLLAFIWYLVYEFIFKIAVAEKILKSKKFLPDGHSKL